MAEKSFTFKSDGLVTQQELDALADPIAHRPTVLVIAASDSGGGAGVTADCITIHDCGGWPLPALTASTAQSLRRVAAVEAIGSDAFSQSLALASSDWPAPKAVKVGFISSDEILKITLAALEGPLSGAAVVWDPVLTATSGRMSSADIKAQLPRILKVSAVFTPNLDEALELAGWDSARYGIEGPQELGREFLSMGAKAVIIKGGHDLNAPRAVDTFVSEDLCFSMELPKLKGRGAHGGGCALSSALAAFLAQGYAPQDAAVLAKAYVYEGIMHPDFMAEGGRPPVGHHGMPVRLEFFPSVQETGFPRFAGPFRRCPLALGAYPVVDSPEWLARCVRDGARTVQLRIKTGAEEAILEKIRQAVKICREGRARLFVDDWYELAIKAGAYGVHLGMEDLRTADLELIRRAGLRLGVSTHGVYELVKAMQLNPSYIAVGHIFPTNTKSMPSKPQGVVKLRRQIAAVGNNFPLTCIGGINESNAGAVIGTGIRSVALVTAITRSPDPDGALKRWIARIGNGGEEIPREERHAL
ncbi:MAG: thiamine phosphate synthase [Aeromonadales bacterium]|nr:thiamine phosphate synthase [Aeromonadales bacterium]MDY2890584.1 thiamine phosphate synthase [Succinivibrio sp.]